MVRIQVPPTVRDFYTDILAHSFDPSGQFIAAATTTGKIIVLQRDWENNEAFARMETTLPGSTPALGLDWNSGRLGVVVCGRSLLHVFPPADPSSGEMDESCTNPIPFPVLYDVQDVASRPSGATVFGACDDCKVRCWDTETQKLVAELTDHKMPLEVCKANEEYVVSGGQDGNVLVYDAALRTTKPVGAFAQGKSTITGLDISSDSTWIAAGSSSAPSVYNLKNSAILPRINVENPQKIYTVHFDSMNGLWWGGGGGRIFKSSDLTKLETTFETTFGSRTIHHVYSITTTNPRRLSAAGSSTGVLFSENADYWEGMVHV